MILGLDLGGTQIRGGLVDAHSVSSIHAQRIHSSGSLEAVVQEVYSFIESLINPSVTAIGIGVPGLVDPSTGMIYDVVNIPSWKQVPLGEMMEAHFKMPVFINNDANCFALGEYHFGKGKGLDSMVGLAVGTGLGSGLILNKKLYAGVNGGAGEFGMIKYMGQYHEYYSSGQFFKNIYNEDGETIFKAAKNGDTNAQRMYEEMGAHLGNAIKNILFALDPELIVLGGSVRQAFPFFSTAMWEAVKTFPFQRSLKKLRIEVSELENSGILGAAALHLQK